LKYEEKSKPKNGRKRDAKTILDQATNIINCINNKFTSWSTKDAIKEITNKVIDFDPEEIKMDDHRVRRDTIEFDTSHEYKTSMRVRSRMRGSNLNLWNSDKWAAKYSNSRLNNRSISPKTTKFNQSSSSKRSEKYRWSKILRSRRKYNQNELSNTHHENNESQDLSETAYILINEPGKNNGNKNEIRAQTSYNNNRVPKLKNPLFSL